MASLHIWPTPVVETKILTFVLYIVLLPGISNQVVVGTVVYEKWMRIEIENSKNVSSNMKTAIILFY